MRQPPQFNGSNTTDGIRTFVMDVVRWADMELRNRPEGNTAWGSILLVSPNGSVYTVKVTDAGVLTTSVVLDKNP